MKNLADDWLVHPTFAVELGFALGLLEVAALNDWLDPTGGAGWALIAIGVACTLGPLQALALAQKKFWRCLL